MARIVIKTVAELKQFQARLKMLANIFATLQKQAVDKISNELVLDEIHTRMRLNDFSPKIIDAIFVGRTDIVGNFAVTHYISNYKAETGFDVSSAREEGTHHPNPTIPKKPGGSLRWFAESGEPIFRKKSHPSGIERLLIIEKTIKENQLKAGQQIGEELSVFSGKFLGA